MENSLNVVKNRFLVLFFCLGALMVNGQVITGAERMEEYLPLLEGKRVAVCGNQTSVVGNVHLVGNHAADNTPARTHSSGYGGF